MTVQTPGCVPAPYHPLRPADTPLYRTVQNPLVTLLALCRDAWQKKRVTPHATRELRRYLDCEVLAYEFARVRCGDCGHDFLVAFSCKGRGVCPSCDTRRMAETVARLADHVLPRLPVRRLTPGMACTRAMQKQLPRVRSFPKRLRCHLQHDPDALNSALRIFVDTIERHLREQSRGTDRKARTGAVALVHRIGSSLNQHTRFHVCVIHGVFEPAPKQGTRWTGWTLLAPKPYKPSSAAASCGRCCGVSGPKQTITRRWRNGIRAADFVRPFPGDLSSSAKPSH